MTTIKSRRSTSGIAAPVSPKLSGFHNLRAFRVNTSGKMPSLDQGNRTSVSWVAIIVSVFSLLAPVGYLVGYYFADGYLRGFGIDQGLFLRSVQEYVAESFKAISVLVGVLGPVLEYSTYKKWLLICAGIGAYALVLVLCLRLLELAISKSRLSGKISKHVKKQSTVVWFFSGAVLLLIPPILVYVLAFLVLPAWAGNVLGNKAAEQEIQAFMGCTVDSPTQSTAPKTAAPESCISVYAENKVIAQGKIIATSDKYLALFTGEKSVVIAIRPEMLIVRSFQLSSAMPNTK